MNDFELYNKCRIFNEFLFNKVIHNIPKVHNTLRIKMENTSIKLIEDVFYAYFNSGNIRKKYMLECLVDISMLDYLIRYFYDNNILLKKLFMI